MFVCLYISFNFSLSQIESHDAKKTVLSFCGRKYVLPLPSKFAKEIEAITRTFIWRGKLEKLALDEIKNSREEGGLDLVCVRSKADALFLRQICRLLANQDFNSFKRIKFWIGNFLGDVIPIMQGGQHPAIVPDYFQHLKDFSSRLIGNNQ